MAITTQIPETIDTLFTKFEHQKTLLTNCTNLYKTLTNHFNILQNSLDSKSKTLDSKLQSLDSSFYQSLNSFKTREDSIPELLISISSTVESRKNAAISELSKPIPNQSAELGEILRVMCRRMNPGLLMRLLVEKTRETSSLRYEMAEAFTECVDAERFVVDAVKVFVEMKREKSSALSNTRWACSMLVRSLFSPEELKVGRSKKEVLSRVFARKAVERAAEVLKEWKAVADCEGAEGVAGGTGMGPAEAAMFIEVSLGFGLKEMFEESFYDKLMIEFCSRRDMAKLAIPVYGDKIADLIEELVKNGKEVDAVYFASESGLTERFQPVSLLKASLLKSKKETADILKQGNNSSSATEKANNLEITSIKSIIKCVDELKLEDQFPVGSLRKRVAALEKAKYEKKIKNDRKKGPTASYSKGSNTDRARTRFRDRTQVHQTSGPATPRPGKIQKLSSQYPTFAVQDRVPPAQLSPVSRYLGPTTYPSQTAYPSQTTYPSLTTYETGITVPEYVPSYSGSQIAASAAPAATNYASQQYGVPGDSVTAPSEATNYAAQHYVSYDYGAAAYHPPSYPQ